MTATGGGIRQGRPPKYNNCLDLAWGIESYFDYCDEGETVTKIDKQGKPYELHRQIPYTFIGMAVHLGMDRDNLADYSSRSKDFYRVLKNAVARIENQRGLGLLTGDSNTIGSIFYLKAMHGWRDTPEQAQSSGITVIIEGGGSVKLASGQAQTEAIDCDYKTVSVSLPQGSE
jgi:hypothetical protein